MLGKNNPLNLEYSEKNNWQGAIRPHNGKRFDNFQTITQGVRAGRITLTTYYKRGLMTVEKIINTFAPPVENDTKNYVNFVANGLNVKPNQIINIFDHDVMYNLLRLMSKMETNYNLTIKDYEDSIFQFQCNKIGDNCNYYYYSYRFICFDL